jgi:hypothetical protein
VGAEHDRGFATRQPADDVPQTARNRLEVGVREHPAQDLGDRALRRRSGRPRAVADLEPGDRKGP